MISVEEYVKIRKAELKETFSQLKKQIGDKIVLHIFRVGNNEASAAYVKGKVKDGEELGVDVCVHHQPKLDYNSIQEFAAHYHQICKEFIKVDGGYGGVILQLPLPQNMSAFVTLGVPELIDVDGFNKDSYVNPCTPQGIIDYLKYNNIELEDKNAVIVGRSDIVGKPMARMLLEENSNVTVLHSHTSPENKKQCIKQADIIVCAVGKRNVLNSKDFEFKPSAIVVDVGINRDENGKLCGDCEKGLPVAFQTPVPKGAGLLTRVSLYSNLALLVKKQYKEREIWGRLQAYYGETEPTLKLEDPVK